MKLPKWVKNTSALNWPSKMPIADFKLDTFLIVLAVSIVLIVIGLVSYKKRDLRG